MIKINFEDKEAKQFDSGISAEDVVKETYGRKSGAVAVLIEEKEYDLSQKLLKDCKIDLIKADSDEGLYILRHSCAHLLAQAVTELFPKAKPTIGPPVDDGFYYDFYMDPINDDDLKKIEKKMKEMVKQNISIIREEHDNNTLRKIFSENQFKIEIIDDKLGQKNGSSAYKQADFIDLCKGPHVSSTSKLQWFKLTSTSQAYWRADSNRESLVRIYGMCYASKNDLKEREKQLREAALRDHKKIGKEMELYMINELIGKGLPIWLPNGEILKNEIEKFANETEELYGYEKVTTPVLGKKQLFEASGHLPHYAESMYPPMKMDDGTYYLKAMNCPMHHLIYRNKKRSYRELPVRIAE
ncbi:threonine--tRNA ligase, partial [Euryarchaeota archaeon]|nr:threonine--tRNA ligase [Euryarchaeota archaeon]